ncbi:MAG TPA: hypothetical protein DCG53_01035 [Syntrophus sp. (in: bacteria)]|jgi:hypothetical protein|nr:hypothetical protein [Syntrophus sp. (in: bacteria)]
MDGHYFKVVIAGHYDFIRGFINGLLTGRGIKEESFFGEDYNIDDERTFEMLARLAGVRGEHTVIIVKSQVLEIIRDVIVGKGEKGGLNLVSVHRIKDAFFTFSIQTFSREIGKELDHILTEASSGLKIEPPYAPQEKETPEGRGVEAYAPLHDYEFQAEGSISGDCAKIFHCYRNLKHYEVVDLGPVEINIEK